MSKRLALIIHNQTYAEPKLSQLKTPVADTPTLAGLLRDPAIGNFDIVELAINQPADALHRWLADLFHRKQRHDELLLYFVGHGLVDEAGQLYLATIDTRLDALAETAISAAYLTECMDRSFSRRQILLLDCNYSHIAAPGVAADVRPTAAFQGKGYGRVVLTAADTIQSRLGEDGITGAAAEASLTLHLLQVLQTGAADADGDGQIDLKELYQYIQQQLNQARLRVYGQQGDFIVAHNPHRFTPTQPLKWDLISGAILTPLTIIVIGGGSDLRASIGMAGLFLLLYALLYLAPD